MAKNILIKRSSIPDKEPLTTDLELGELALNTNDGVMYVKKNDGVESIVEITDKHTNEPDPHPQYLTPSDLPETVVSWFENATSLNDGAFKNSTQTQPVTPETSVSAVGLTTDVPVKLGQWMREEVFTTDLSLFETTSILQMDVESDQTNVEIYAVIGLKRAIGGIFEPFATSDRIILKDVRETITLPIQIAGPIDILVGDVSYTELWIVKTENGPNPNVELFMEGSNSTRVITALPIATYPAPHAISHEEGGIDEVLHDNLNGAGVISHATIDTELPQKTRWLNKWVAQEYIANDMVRDGDWTMIANKTTTDRPAPQELGDAVFLQPDENTWAIPSTGAVVHSGHEYEFAKGGWLKELRVWIPELTTNTHYRFLVLDVTDPGNIVQRILPEPALKAGAWSSVALGSYIVAPDTKLRFIVDSLNSGSDTLITGGWRYDGTSNSAFPAAQGWNRHTNDTMVRIDKTDLDTTDRTSELLGVTVNSTIRLAVTASPSIYKEYRVEGTAIDQGSCVEYPVSLISDSGTIAVNDTCTIDIAIPVPQTTKYVEDVGYWAANTPDFLTSATGFVTYNGVDQGVDPTNAYGIDFKWQEADVSEDWDLVALSGTSSGSGGGGSQTGEIFKDRKTYTNVKGQTTLEVTYDGGNLEVFYNGVLLDPSEYTADNGIAVVLNTPVADAADVIDLIGYAQVDLAGSVRIKKEYENILGQDTFDLDSGFGLTDVLLNGVMLPTQSYTIVNSQVILNTPIQSADDILTTHGYGNYTITDAEGTRDALSVYSKAETDAKDLVAKAGRKNYLINGDFSVAQRGAVSVGGSNIYTLDRWYAKAAGANIAIDQIFTSGIPYMRILGAVSNTQILIGQRIESLATNNMTGSHTFSTNLYHTDTVTVNWSVNTPNAKDDYSSVTPIASGTFETFGGGYRPFEFTFDIPSAANGLEIILDFGALVDTKAIYIKEAQLEQGDQATSLEYVSPQQNLAECQRYYQVLGNGALNYMFYSAAATTYYLPITYLVPMNKVPSVDITYSAIGGTTNVAENNPRESMLNIAVIVDATAGRNGFNNAIIKLSSEL